MSWTPYYRGTGAAPEARPKLPAIPPWRAAKRASETADADAPTDEPSSATAYRPPPGLVDAVNAALHLRRPLLLTGHAGSGKSTVIEQIAVEAALGPVLRWHITSRSTLTEALYRYDALGRIHAENLRRGRRPRRDSVLLPGRDGEDDIGEFVQLGPLGTALLPGDHPRALLIDEIDKSDLDLPSDLLDVLERGRFEIPELARHPSSPVTVRTADPGQRAEISDGLVESTEFPVIVLTSNGERDFPPPFLRRCIRFDMPPLTAPALAEIVAAHQLALTDATAEVLSDFAARINAGEHLAIDQLLNAVYLLGGDQGPGERQGESLVALLLQELGRG